MMNSLKNILSYFALVFGTGTIYQNMTDSVFGFESIYLSAMALLSEEISNCQVD